MRPLAEWWKSVDNGMPSGSQDAPILAAFTSSEEVKYKYLSNNALFEIHGGRAATVLLLAHYRAKITQILQ